MTVVLVTVVVELKQHCLLSIQHCWLELGKRVYQYTMNNNERHDSVRVKLMVTYQCQSQDKPTTMTKTMVQNAGTEMLVYSTKEHLWGHTMCQGKKPQQTEEKTH